MFTAIYRLFSAADKRRLLFIFILMLGATGLEALGIGLILPVLALLTQAADKPLIVAALLLLCGVFIIKAGYLFFTTARQTAFFTTVERELSTRLLAHYLRQPYVFHLQRNSAELLGRLNDLRHFANALGNLLQLLTESLTLGGITALLLFTEFYGTLVLIAIGGGGFMLLHYTLRHYLRRLGEVRLHADLARQQHALQALNGVKEIKLYGREKEFIARYAAPLCAYTQALRRYLTLTFLPRYCLEVAAVGGLAALVTVLLHQEKNPHDFLPTIGLFVAAVFRVLPAINRIIHYAQSLQFLGASVNSLTTELLFTTAPATTKDNSALERPLHLREKLEVFNLGFTYPHATTPTLKNLNLTINAKTTVGIMGASGAGKSTLLDLLLGILTPSTGKILLDGVDLATNVRGWQATIGYVPQLVYLADDTLRRNVAFGLPDEEIDDEKFTAAIAAAQLHDVIANLPHGVQTVIGEGGVKLSGGERQRLGIARALYVQPEVLVLDEATAALDLTTEQQIMQAIRALHGQQTIIIVAHRADTVAECDEIFDLNSLAEHT